MTAIPASDRTTMPPGDQPNPAPESVADTVEPDETERVPAPRRSTTATPTHRSANDAISVPTDRDRDGTATNPTGDTLDSADTAGGTHQPSAPTLNTSNAETAVGRTKRGRRDSRTERSPGAATAELAGKMLTPQQWAQEQLKDAPPRSRAWGRRVAAIYGLELPEE